ncbi:MAG: hypothetical protein SFX72_07105 [Isosphaeraceae bacterium]|nr:hypothetical protein [Isosphaeraceae bacterium]
MMRRANDPPPPGHPALLLGAHEASRAVLALAFAVAWVGAAFAIEPGGGAAVPEPLRFVPRAIAVEGERTEFDLEGRKNLVVISTLAGGDDSFAIGLTTAPTPAARRAEGLAASPRRPRPALVPPPPPPPPPAAFPPRDRSFCLLARDGDPASAANYVTIPARLIAVGKRIQVYADPGDLAKIDRGLISELVAAFDDAIHPLAAKRFGTAADVDGDGRFTILVSSWLDRMAGGRAQVDGFVRGADLDRELSPPFGNRCDMMYLNPAIANGPHGKTVLAHEYTHAVVFSRRIVDARPDVAGRPAPRVEEEGWLDEALAHLVEDLHGFSKSNIDYRVSAFLSAPERYRLVVDDYYAANLFRSHGHRGATYLFLRWLVDREGDEVIDRLIRSRLEGVANLEEATGRSFADLYREWSVALFTSGIAPEGAPAAEGEYRSIDPRGTLEDWILAGPRTTTLRTPRSDLKWSMGGTSSRYILVENAGTEPLRLSATAPAASGLQITVVPLPDDLGSIELSVRSIPSSTGERLFRAVIEERAGFSARVGALCWEPLAPSRPSQAFRSGLDMLGVASAFGGSSLTPLSRKTSRTIALGRAGDSLDPLVFKAVGFDAKGRRIAAWAVAEPLPGDPSEAALPRIAR